jgi:hypothetical protein
MLGELALGLLCPKWEQEVGESPAGAAGACRTVGRVLRAPWGIGDVVFRCPDRDSMVDRVVLGHVVGIDMAGVQEAEMRSIDVAFQSLQIVAVALDAAHADLVIG